MQKAGACAPAPFLPQSRLSPDAVGFAKLAHPAPERRRKPSPASGLLDAVGFVAAAALLADQAKLGLQGIDILDLALGVADRLGEGRDMLVKAGLVVPDFWRGLVVTLERLALEAR